MIENRFLSDLVVPTTTEVPSASHVDNQSSRVSTVRLINVSLEFEHTGFPIPTPYTHTARRPDKGVVPVRSPGAGVTMWL